MCGIVGYVGSKPVVPVVVAGLRALEYRGYDSAGVVVTDGEATRVVKAPGKLDNLVSRLGTVDFGSLDGEASWGLGHTRWATHGVPNELNAHPHADSNNRLAIIHNGIIENYLPIKRRLIEEGWSFASDTDTEVVANLISKHFETTGDLLQATIQTVGELEGMYAFAVIAQDASNEIIAARQGPPLALGLGEGEQFLASDPAALLAYTKDVVFLENGEFARLRRSGVEVFDASGAPIDRAPQRLNWDPVQVEKGGYKHFMLKEIHEQPQALQATLAGRVDFEGERIGLDELGLDEDDLRKFDRVHLLACGTSWHSALVGKFLIEELARVPVLVDYGSEYRYRDPIVDDRVLAIGISQSGETADTLSAMEAARAGGARLLAIANVKGSQATRISDGTLYTYAGPEIGVASTKAFTTQLLALYLLALYLRQVRIGPLGAEHLAGLAHLPASVDEVLRHEEETGAIAELARQYARARDFLYLGRSINYPIALEGALKLKEISYIHAEGYPAGEMKHGPIALIDEDLPVVALATGETVFDKVLSNMQEVKARDGIVLAVSDRDEESLEGVADELMWVPTSSRLLQPIVNVIPLQLLAYFIGVRRGADVDQPRNLAKSVTVE